MVDKVRNWLVQRNVKELYPFLGLALYYHHFIPKFTHVIKCLHQLIALTNIKKSKDEKKEVTILGFHEQDKK